MGMQGGPMMPPPELGPPPPEAMGMPPPGMLPPPDMGPPPSPLELILLEALDMVRAQQAQVVGGANGIVEAMIAPDPMRGFGEGALPPGMPPPEMGMM
mgnify:CR=1 FL=1